MGTDLGLIGATFFDTKLDFEREACSMEPEIYRGVGPGLVFLIFAFFAAYWAQTTRRNAVLWFLLGLFFGPITGFVLLQLNAIDLRQKRAKAGSTD